MTGTNHLITLNHSKTLWKLAMQIFEAFVCKLAWPSCSMWDKLGWFNWFWQFLCVGISSFNPKEFYCSYAFYCSLCEGGRTSFCTGHISRKLCRFVLMFLTGFTSYTVLHLFPVLITFFIFKHDFRFYFI